MAAATENRRIAPAGEWLLDNFYLIEEQIHTAKRHLPKGYSRELPRLRQGHSAGLPRVYDIALEVIAHGDGRVDPENLSRFIAAYQTVTSLTLGELWAIPIMLRLTLIEHLRRVAARISACKSDQNLADGWADRMTVMAEKDPKNLVLVIADMARSNPPTTSAFVAELTRRLQGQSSALALPLTWIEQYLAESGQTIEQLVQTENQHQAADQVSISNSIGSLRFLGAMDWREFVETMSVVDRTLSTDPAGIYGQMDFATRDRYRHAVERIAKQGRLSEAEVARQAVTLAVEGAAKPEDGARNAHVGFYLIDRGLAHLETRAQVCLCRVDALQRRAQPVSLWLYLGAIAVLTGVLSWGLLAHAQAGGTADWLLALLAVPAVLGASHLAVALANWLATRLAAPHPLPRMDYSAGIPPEARTLVVTPTLLSSAAGVESLVEALEVRFLANRDDSLHFGLLTDFCDAREATLPADESLVELAAAGVAALNARYPRSLGDIFFLFHRPRRWNPQEQVWMGYERKRGKLADLNALLRGNSGDRFSRIVGDPAILLNVKYVITLDTDTQLPRDAARELIGTMAHPLNRAAYDRKRQRVCRGYGILQPRVAVSLPASTRSRYERLYGSDAGIDPYTQAVSDVYQDWFQEGSFIGKGIYDVDAFEQALGGRFPENRILSHDLLEGCYARSGLLSDVLLYEEYPACYGADVSRRYRWIRGDWQIARWLFPMVPEIDGGLHRNPLSALSRWKLFDNLRRSLVPGALTLLFVFGWLALSSAWTWTLGLLSIILIPALIVSLLDLLQKPGDVRWDQHLAAALRTAERQLTQATFTLACLPYEAFFSLGAVTRTLWRMGLSHRHLLEWTSSGEQDRKPKGIYSYFAMMKAAPVLALATALALALFQPAALAVAGPILLLWFAAPAIAWWISQPLPRQRARLTVEQTLFLRTMARKTWAFFETFVGPQEHWLPPDNYQEHPAVVVAHRTSPTNMGLSLLANLGAYDFGYLTAGGLVERTARSLRTMAGLERYHGHFFNWYDTQSLTPLHPTYVSSVDSGNLAGHLLTLQQGLLGLIDAPILGPRWLDGIEDSLRVLAAAVNGPLPADLADFSQTLDSVCQERATTLIQAHQCIERLATLAEAAAPGLDANAGGRPTSGCDPWPGNAERAPMNCCSWHPGSCCRWGRRG